mmetsp:Transcript_4236/g.5973  ORF Transcript_4236/g.5973 Transcript_4236/m.5973 type:complete len:264 (+) Transcript_4236:64-855(+)
MPPKAKKKKGKKEEHSAPNENSLSVNFICDAAEKEYVCKIPVGGKGEKINLEARIANQSSGDIAIIFLHALPPSGNMYIPEIALLQARLASEGYVTIRFNFRGVGLSDGRTYFRSAQQDVDDARDVTRWVSAHRKHYGLSPFRKCYIIGVSYGSVIAAAAAGSYDEFDGYIAIAYPLQYLWFCTSFDSARFHRLANTTKRKLLVWGETDVFAGRDAMASFYHALPEPKKKIVLSQLDSILGHYFRSKEHLDCLSTAVLDWLKQ